MCRIGPPSLPQSWVCLPHRPGGTDAWESSPKRSTEPPPPRSASLARDARAAGYCQACPERLCRRRQGESHALPMSRQASSRGHGRGAEVHLVGDGGPLQMDLRAVVHGEAVHCDVHREHVNCPRGKAHAKTHAPPSVIHIHHHLLRAQRTCETREGRNIPGVRELIGNMSVRSRRVP